MPDIDTLRRLLPSALIALLVAVWLGGGVTQDGTAIDEWLQLLALPVLLLAGVTLISDWPGERIVRLGIACALAIALVPALQLLPLPDGWWQAVTARHTLAADLAEAGISGLDTRATLSPGGTEAALWSLLPALAAFMAALAFAPGSRRLLVKAIMLLVLGNVLFAFFQAGLPRDSALRLYQNSDVGFGGLLANTNHQATALIVAMVLAIGQAAHAWHREQAGRGRPHAWLWYAVLAGFCFLVVPLSTSRAGVALALPALAATLLLCGALPLHRVGRSKRATALLLSLAVLAIIGIRAALGWIEVDQTEELRHVIAGAAVDMARAQSPWGGGVGSFVQVFEQSAPSSLWVSGYVNHVHNEYVQWWLEAGWLGLLVMAGLLVMLLAVGWRVARARARDGNAILAASCFVAICAVLAHSWADFPLRTTTLMTTTAALAGLMIAALAEVTEHARNAAGRLAHSPGEGAQRA